MLPLSNDQEVMPSALDKEKLLSENFSKNCNTDHSRDDTLPAFPLELI